MENYREYPNLPWILYAPCGCKGGGFFVYNQQTKEHFKVDNVQELHQYAADASGQGARVPLGDMVHKVTQKLGLRRCSSCAQRQSRFNRFFG